MGSARMQVPVPGVDRSSTLVRVAVLPAARRHLPSARRRAVARAPAGLGQAAVRAPSQPEETLTALPRSNVGAPHATLPLAEQLSDGNLLDSPATRRAIGDVARGSTLALRGNELTHEAPGSMLPGADGSHTGNARSLAPSSPAERLRLAVEAAHKADCMSGEYFGSGQGLPSIPFLLAAEAMGKCAHKL